MADEMKWTPDAESALKKIPFFFRKKARNATEEYARQHGQSTMTMDLFREAMQTVAPGGPGGPPGPPSSG